MSSGALSLRRAFAYNLKFVNLASVKQIKFSFDPFVASNASLRDVLHVLHGPAYRKTNSKAALKIDVRSDRCNPTMEVKFNDDQVALFKTENLQHVDIIKEFNKLCTEKSETKKGKK